MSAGRCIVIHVQKSEGVGRVSSVFLIAIFYFMCIYCCILGCFLV